MLLSIITYDLCNTFKVQPCLREQVDLIILLHSILIPFHNSDMLIKTYLAIYFLLIKKNETSTANPNLRLQIFIIFA